MAITQGTEKTPHSKEINLNLNILCAHLNILLKQQFKKTESKLSILLIRIEILNQIGLPNLKIISSSTQKSFICQHLMNTQGPTTG